MIRMTIKKAFPSVSRKQATDFGLVLVLVLLFFGLYLHRQHFFIASFVFTLVTIVVPVIYNPFARVWFGLSRLMGSVSSRILMGAVFFLVVVPVGLFRRLMGKDSLKLKQFKQGNHTVMIDRNHTYTKDDLSNTF